MKFTLVYEGPLTPDGSVKEKWDIRKQLDPQLRELWAMSNILKTVLEVGPVPKTIPFTISTPHHSVKMPPSLAAVKLSDHKERIDLCEIITVGDRKFLPIVRDSLALKCGLKIKFLRKEEPGKLIYQGGDIDNRLKTLFDALGKPQANQIVDDKDLSDPIHCLFEDDRLVTSIDVDTQKLLKSNHASKHEVILIIEVDVKVTLAANYNLIFLGD